MNTRVTPLVAALGLAGLPALVLAGVSSYPTSPGFGEPSYSQAQYDAHYADGLALGKQQGQQETAAECLGDPGTCGCAEGLSPCGITISSLLPGSNYAETEPNDGPAFANILVPDQTYSGQSRNAQDQDWYAVTTQEPNQIITIDFLAPGQTSSSGWDITVRDANGTVLAEFPSDLASEVVYPVAVSTAGIHYVVVQPSSSATLNSHVYNLGVHLSFSSSDAPPTHVALYGETESNDSLASANALVPGKTFSGQSSSALDQDWFYVNAEEPNEIINVGFVVPGQTSTSGWDITVRDKAANILADFPSSLVPGTGYPVYVSWPGTYYLVIKPQSAAALNQNIYNLTATLTLSSSQAPPVDVNFFDVETEPNNTPQTANPITNSVSMYGMLSTSLVGDATVGWALQTEEDWFYYSSPGNETATLSWCQRQACPATAGRAWRVTVTDRADNVLTSFSTDGSSTAPQTVYMGLGDPGDYFIEVMSDLKTDANGQIVTSCRQWNLPDANGNVTCASYAPVAMTTTDQYNFTWQSSPR
jgi:hypothetical protein